MINQQNRFLTAVAVSTIGTGIFEYGFNYYITHWMESVTMIGYVRSTLTVLVMVVNFFAGYYLDNLSKKYAVVFIDSIAAIISFVAAIFLTWPGANRVFVLIFSWMAIQLLMAAYAVASRSIYKFIFNPKEFGEVNRKQTIVKQSLRIIAPAVGVVIVGQFSPILFFIINGLSFFISALMEVKLKEKKQKNKNVSSISQHIKSNIEFLINNKGVTFNILSASLFNLFVSMYEANQPLLTMRFLNNNSLYGVLTAAMAAGAVVGPLISTKLRYDIEKYSLSLAYISMIISFSIPNLLVISSFLLGAFVSLFNVYFFTRLQIEIPEERISSLLSWVFLFSGLLVPIGQLFSGYMYNTFTNNVLIVIGFLGLVISIGVKFLFKRTQN